jgi:hypothetical protein
VQSFHVVGQLAGCVELDRLIDFRHFLLHHIGLAFQET